MILKSQEILDYAVGVSSTSQLEYNKKVLTRPKLKRVRRLSHRYLLTGGVFYQTGSYLLACEGAFPVRINSTALSNCGSRLASRSASVNSTRTSGCKPSPLI